MTSFRTNTLSVTVAAIILCALALFSGCSQTPTSSVAPVEEPTQPSFLQRGPSSSAALANLSGQALYTEQVISSEFGGVLELFDVTLTIPPGAVPNDTLFSIDIPDSEVFFNHFGTDGLVFDVPVWVEMSYRDADLSGINESSIRIGYLNEVTGKIVDIDCVVDTDRKVVIGQLMHFSAYGLISD